MGATKLSSAGLDQRKPRKRAARSPYYPDTMSRDARRAVEAANDWRTLKAWRSGMVDAAADVAAWRAASVIEAA